MSWQDVAADRAVSLALNSAHARLCADRGESGAAHYYGCLVLRERDFKYALVWFGVLAIVVLAYC
jgi:hypothetical protein